MLKKKMDFNLQLAIQLLERLSRIIIKTLSAVKLAKKQQLIIYSYVQVAMNRKGF